MGLQYMHLDPATRRFMVEEVDLDVAGGTLYLSPWLSEGGRRDWSGLLREAVDRHNDDWLANQLRQRGRILETAIRRKPRGGTTTYRVPDTAPFTMSEGEFNRCYIRGLCRRAIEEHVGHLIVYRAKTVENPRPESEQRIGTHVDPQTILADIRSNPGVETAFGIPPGPNSGLCVRLP